MMELEEALDRLRGGGGVAAVLEVAVSRYAEEDPAGGRALSVCALPTFIDDDVFAISWAAADGGEPPAVTLGEQVATLGLVNRQPDGRWEMHASVRTLLLEGLRSAKDRNLLRRGAAALVELFEVRASRARLARLAAIEVAPALHAANPARLQHILRRVDGASTPPAVEAIQVASQIDPESGAFILRRQVLAEVNGSNAVGLDGLLSAARRLLPTAEWPVSVELALADADLRLLTNDLTGAETVLVDLEQQLIDGDALDRCRDRLFRCLSQQSREREALAVAKRRAATSPEDDDPTNLAALVSIAQMQLRIGDVSDALATCGELIGAAADRGSLDLAACGSSVAALGELLRGNRIQATERLIVAFDQSRMDSGRNPAAAAMVATAAVEVFTTGPLEMLSSALAEAEAIAPHQLGRGWELFSNRLELLDSAGRINQALEVIDALGALPEPRSTVEWEIVRSIANISRSAGRWDLALELHNKVEAGGGAAIKPIDRQAMLADRGLLHLACSRLDEAEQDLRAAASSPLIAEHPIYGPICKSALGVARARRGDIEGAMSLIAEADVPSELAVVESFRRSFRAEVLELAGDLCSALADRRIHCELQHDLGYIGEAAQSALKAAGLASQLRRWPEAVELQQRAAQLVELSASIDTTEPRPVRSVRAGQATLASLGLDPAGLSSAEAAIELNDCHAAQPTDWWVGLDAAYAAMRAGLFDLAQEVFLRMDMASPTIAAHPVILQRRSTIAQLLARRSIALGEGGRALSLLSESAQLSPEASDSLTLESLTAFAYVADGRTKDAMAWLVAREEDDADTEPAMRLLRHALRGIVAVLAGFEEEVDVHFGLAADIASEAGLHPYWTVVRAVDMLAMPHQVGLLARVLGQPHRFDQGVAMSRFGPTISSLLPDGWQVKQSITMLAPDGRSNVIASSEPIDPEWDTQRYADEQGEVLSSEFPGYEELEGGPLELQDGANVVRRVFRWSPPDGEPVTQVQMYLADVGTGYTATATATSQDYGERAVVLGTVLQSLVFRGAAAAPATS